MRLQVAEIMKRILLALLIIAATRPLAIGQATQHCVVYQYNQKQKKTPLAGVEVMVSNAGSAVSAANGTLTLNFRTLKPGDKVNMISAHKSGYEIFNRSAVDQWFISRDNATFAITMVNSGYFAQLKRNLRDTSVASYKAKYDKAKADITRQQKLGKLKEKEYKQRLDQLEEQYQNQLLNIDHYIEVFSRFDLSELSDEEARIIEMVHKGQIDEAVEAYEKLKIIERYESALENREQLTQHIDAATAERDRQQQMADSILAIIERQHITLADLTQRMRREDMSDHETYLRFVKMSLDSLETLYARDPNRYREDLNLVRKEWERLSGNYTSQDAAK